MEAETKFLIVACWLFSIPLVYKLSPFSAAVMAIFFMIAVYLLIEMRGLR